MGKQGRSRVQENTDLFTIEDHFLEYNRLAVKLNRINEQCAFGHPKITKEEAIWRGLYEKEILMARKSIQREQINENVGRKLEQPFPSSPHSPPRYTIYFERKGRQHSVHAFRATYAAKKFLDAVLEGIEFKWITPSKIEAPDLVIRAQGSLEEVMEYEYKKNEVDWELPDPYPAQARSIATGQSVKIEPSATKDPETGKSRTGNETVTRSGKIDRGSLHRGKLPKRQSITGLISIADIAAEMKIEPRIARAALRKANVSKPDAGWAWPKNEVDAIKKVIRS